MTPQLTSVVIVNYNGSRFLRECLTALAEQSMPRHLYEIIVVDNASHDDSLALLRTEFPWVRCLPLASNRGFAGGNNAGFAIARGSAVVLLNNDTHADPHWLAELLSRPTDKAMASKLVFHADPQLVNSSGLALLPDGRGTDTGFRRIDTGQYEQPTDCFGACGAAMLIPRSWIDAHGGFDDRLFMYCEDLDLAWQAQLQGNGVGYVPSSLVRHIHCGSSGEWSAFFTYHLERNRVWVNLRNADLFLAIWTLIGFIARVGRAFARNRHPWAYLRAAWSVARSLPRCWIDRYAVRSRYR